MLTTVIQGLIPGLSVNIASNRGLKTVEVADFIHFFACAVAE
jgi:hypothetical protein